MLQQILYNPPLRRLVVILAKLKRFKISIYILIKELRPCFRRCQLK